MPRSSLAGRTVSEVVRTAAGRLGSVSEARWIVAHVTGLPVGELAARAGDALDPDAVGAVDALVRRCRSGEPVQYALGTWSFRGLELAVDRRVLIPRPETEVLVDVALDELRAQARAAAGDAQLVAVDLGSGSGAVALSLAAEFDPRRALAVWATDAAEGALAVLRHNLDAMAARHPDAARRVRVGAGDWFAALPGALAGSVALVVSNPPYVSEAEWADLDPRVREHEPKGALVPGPSGLEAVGRIVRQARRWLAPGGSLVLEMAPSQVPVVGARAAALGYAAVESHTDLAGRPRVVVARTPS